MQANIIEGTHHKFEPVGPFDDNFEIETQDEHSNFTNGSDKSTPPPEVNANELQLNVKLFLREYNQEVALEAINYLISRLGNTTNTQLRQFEKRNSIMFPILETLCNTSFTILGAKVIDNMYVTVPANVIAHIGLTSQFSITETETNSESDSGTPRKDDKNEEIELDPEKTKYAEDMISLWNTLSKIKQVQSLGLCDVETDIFKKIYNEVQIKPKNVQVGNILNVLYTDR